MADVLRGGKVLSPSEIADLLIMHGKMVEGPNSKIIVRNTARRRADLFIITEGERPGAIKLKTEDFAVVERNDREKTTEEQGGDD